MQAWKFKQFVLFKQMFWVVIVRNAHADTDNITWLWLFFIQMSQRAILVSLQASWIEMRQQTYCIAPPNPNCNRGPVSHNNCKHLCSDLVISIYLLIKYSNFKYIWFKNDKVNDNPLLKSVFLSLVSHCDPVLYTSHTSTSRHEPPSAGVFLHHLPLHKLNWFPFFLYPACDVQRQQERGPSELVYYASFRLFKTSLVRVNIV